MNRKKLLKKPIRLISVVLLVAGLSLWLLPLQGSAQTPYGEIENRPAPVGRRKCVAGANAGNLCNEDADCPGSTCVDRNVFTISVAVLYDAPAADITAIQNLISAGSAVLFDVTDGQAEIGEAVIHNNAVGTADADLRIYPSTSPTWWKADTGNWKVGGSMHVSIDQVNAADAPGESLAHEFVHLVFDARDEYESAGVGCVAMPGSNASCPDAAAIAAGEASCLMDNGGTGASDGPFTELCWGQGDAADLTDLSGGNHDATNVTEQSRCRSNRSCWAQVAWSWPNTFLMPTGAPDPAANGATVRPTNFLVVNETVRVVLVLDESGSMGLESPSRMERLKVAAKDFVTLAENGTELGIVSYSDDAEVASGRVNVPIGALGANRAAWTNAINGLGPDGWTNIGAGLEKAKGMIDAATGVAGSTFVVLMTDGLNNRPAPDAAALADLEAKVDMLLEAGIPVYVTCTGSDLGMESQCAEIATGTGGFYVDSADAARLPEAFVDIHERLSGRESIVSAQGYLSKAKGSVRDVFVEQDSESATFTLLWDDQAADAEMVVVDPAGNQYDTLPMPQGRYVRVSSPMAGNWQMVVEKTSNVDSGYVARAYSRNQTHNMVAAVRHASVYPGGDIYVYAYPRSVGGPISHPTQPIIAQVTLPDGSTDILELRDSGRDLYGVGDDIADDGIFTGVYRNTQMKGAYAFLLSADIDQWPQSGDSPVRDPSLKSPRFVRETRLSAAVGDPKDVEPEPEDGPSEPDDDNEWPGWLWRLILLVLLILFILFLVLYIWRRMRYKAVPKE